MTVAAGLIAVVPGRMAAVTMVLLAGFCSFALFPPMISYISEVVTKREDVGAATGVHAVIGFVGALVAPWIFGQVLDAGTRSSGSYMLGYLVLVAFGVAAVAGMAAFRPKQLDPATARR
jgi:MFS family permease